MARVFCLAVGLAMLGVLTWAAPVSAHARLERSDPAPGAVLPRPPATVELTFDEPVAPLFDAVTVTGTSGERHDSHDAHAVPGQPSHVVVDLRDLPGGSYTVSWRVVSDDGHVVAGRFGFGVEAAAVAAPGREITANSDAVAIVHGLWLLALTVLAGGVLFTWLVAPIKPAWTHLLGTFGLAAAAHVAGLVIEGAAAAAVPWQQSLHPAVLGPLLTSTRYGHLWLATAALLTVLALVGARGAWGLGVCLALLLAEAANGHAAAVGPWTPLDVAVDWLP